jgi:hypothetical protein
MAATQTRGVAERADGVGVDGLGRYQIGRRS